MEREEVGDVAKQIEEKCWPRKWPIEDAEPEEKNPELKLSGRISTWERK